jgi:hypothetical protein
VSGAAAIVEVEEANAWLDGAVGVCHLDPASGVAAFAHHSHYFKVPIARKALHVETP